LCAFLQTYSGIYVAKGPAWVQDNDVHDVGAGISLGAGLVTSRANDTCVVGNNIYRFTVDGMGVNPADNMTIAFNHWYDIRIQDPASQGAGLHPDCCQFQNGSMTSTNVRFIGNRFQQGDYAMNPPDDHGAQGPFGGPNASIITLGSITGSVLTVTTKGGGLAIAVNMSLYGTGVLAGTTIVAQTGGTTGGAGTYTVSLPHSTPTGAVRMLAIHEVRNSVVAGNMTVMAEQANQINFGGWVDSVIYNNTAVMDAVGVLGNSSIYPVNPSGLEFRYNIANVVGPDVVQTNVVARTASVYENNNTVLQAAYAANFVDPDSEDAITDLAAQFDTKAGIYATNTTNVIPGANSTYIDFGSRAAGTAWDGTGRTHDFPWAEDGHDIAGDFTDVTDIAISTLTTSNEVTITGVSATGVLVRVTGGTFRVRDASSVLVRDFSSNAYVVPNGYKITLQNTSSGSSETAVTMTVDVGTTTDTWSVSTEVVLTTPDFAYLWTDTSDTNTTSYTFSSKALGSDHANRRLRIAIHTPLVAVSAVSVGGVAATSVASNTHSSIWTLSTTATALAGLTTANVVVTTATTCSRVSISMWVDYASSGTATDFGSDTDASTVDSVVALDVVPDGHVIYVGSQNTSLGTFTTTWAGSDAVVEDYDSQRESTSTVTFGHINTSETATRNLTLSESTSGQKVLVAASFGAPA
jgi:hypothetical protein